MALGLSLGELTACAAAGVFDFPPAFGSWPSGAA
jgi:malonyl CoA-acyl carrier protein transacylase